MRADRKARGADSVKKTKSRRQRIVVTARRSKPTLRSASCELHRELLARCSAGRERDLDSVFPTLVQLRAPLVIGADAFFIDQNERLVALAAHYAVPTIHFVREYATAGGLMSYGGNLTANYSLTGVYTGRILRARSPPSCRSCSPRKSS